MLLALPAFALSALLQVLSPNATASVSQASLTLAVTLHGMEIAQFIDDHSTVEALAGYALTEVERSLQMGSPTDILFYTAPVGAYAWKSSPALRSHTRAAVSLTRLASNVILDTLRGPPGFFDLALPFEPIPHTSLLNSPLNLVFNASSIVEPPRPVYGPEWEWPPRDLIVFVPQPACPVPFLTYDMSTASSIGKCGLGPKRSTVLDELIPIYTPPPTRTISSHTRTMVFSKLPGPYDSRLMDQFYVWILRFALVILAVVGQSCGWYAVIHGKVLNGTVQLKGHSYNPSDSSERDPDATFLGSNDFPLLDPKISCSSLHQPDFIAPNLDDASNEIPTHTSILAELDTPRLGDPLQHACEEAPLVDDANETPTTEVEPETSLTDSADEAADIAVQDINEAIQPTIEAAATINQDARKDPLEAISKDKGKRSVGVIEEDIFESTRALATSLACQKREDRWIARAQRATPTPKPSDAVNEPATASRRSSRREDDGSNGKDSERNGGEKGGKVAVSTGLVGDGQLKDGGGEERRWAGADAGMFRIEIVGEELVVEGVLLKKGKKKRK